MKALAALLVLFAAYKVGEQKAQLEQMDFLLVIGGNYLLIDNTGISLVNDINLATQMSYWDAIQLKRILKKSSTGLDVKLEAITGVSSQIQYV